jgi:phospholipid/cholesterol/gamma-HCH transport system substrate-binding protein
MKPAQSKRAIIVGLFVLCGIIIFVLAILTLGGQKNTFEKTFVLSAVFNDVRGLQAGNNVWFSGVKIGTVDKVRLYQHAQVEVVMHIEKKSQQFIRTNAQAKIGSDGLIGNRIVIIYGGTPEAPMVEPGTVLSVERTLSPDDMMATLQENNKNLLDITANFKQISERMAAGQGTIGKLLTDDQLVNQLEAAVTTLQQASRNAASLTANLDTYASKLQTKGSLANAIVTDTALFSTLQRTVTQIQETSTSAKEAVNNIKKASEELNNTNGTAGVLLHDAETAAYLKTTLKNLESGTQKLDENMEAMQHNFLLRGFFKRKAKAEEQEAIDSSNAAAGPKD